MTRWKKGFAALAAALAVPAALASQTESWRTVGADEFRRGRVEGLAVEPRGRVVLAPARREIARWDEPSGWALASLGGGKILVGTGDDGRVYRVDAPGKWEKIADLAELGVHALAAWNDGAVLAGTSPDGKLYRIAASGKSDVLFDPDDRYIWAVVPAPDGTVLVATGDKARLYRVGRDGKSTILYESSDSHIRAVALGADGTIFLGTSGRGLLVRLDRDGTKRILLDSKRQEIASIAVDSAGTVYAAAMGEERSAAGAGPGAGVTVTVTAEAPPPEEPRVESQQPGAERRPSSPTPAAPPGGGSGASMQPGADIWKIEPDGFARRIWSSKTETVYALAAWGAEGIFAGTGPQGALYRIEPDGKTAWYGNLASGPIASLLPAEGRLWILGSTPAALVSLGPGLSETGTMESRVYDAKLLPVWGTLRWVLDAPGDGNVVMEMRSGNTEEPDSSWSDWSAVDLKGSPSDGAPVKAPPARFAQWRATLKRGAHGGPSLSEVELRFRPRNVAPTVDRITVHPQGVAFQIQPSGGQGPGEAPLLSDRYADAVVRYMFGGRRPSSSPRRLFVPGARTATWDGSDENGDDLLYDVDVQGQGDTRWIPLGKDIKDTFLTWDSRTLADGWYRLRVTASDDPGNPENERLAADKASEPFVIDNTPPRIEILESKLDGRKLLVRFRAEDSAGRISYAEYSVDGGEWKILLPEDRVEDSKTETYRFETVLPENGGHIIVVRAADEGGNWASARVPAAK